MSSVTSWSSAGGDGPGQPEYRRLWESPPTIPLRQRIDSADFAGVGDHLKPLNRQDTFDRSEDLIITHEDHPPPPPPPPPPTFHPQATPQQRPTSRPRAQYSEENVHVLIKARDELKSSGDHNSQPSSSTAPSIRSVSPANDDCHSDSEARTTTGRTRSYQGGEEPRTPVAPSAATTDDGHGDDGKGPVDPVPWSDFSVRKRKRLATDIE